MDMCVSPCVYHKIRAVNLGKKKIRTLKMFHVLSNTLVFGIVSGFFFFFVDKFIPSEFITLKTGGCEVKKDIKQKRGLC